MSITNNKYIFPPNLWMIDQNLRSTEKNANTLGYKFTFHKGLPKINLTPEWFARIQTIHRTLPDSNMDKLRASFILRLEKEGYNKDLSKLDYYDKLLSLFRDSVPLSKILTNNEASQPSSSSSFSLSRAISRLTPTFKKVNSLKRTLPSESNDSVKKPKVFIEIDSDSEEDINNNDTIEYKLNTNETTTTTNLTEYGRNYVQVKLNNAHENHIKMMMFVILRLDENNSDLEILEKLRTQYNISSLSGISEMRSLFKQAMPLKKIIEKSARHFLIPNNSSLAISVNQTNIYTSFNPFVSTRNTLPSTSNPPSITDKAITLIKKLNLTYEQFNICMNKGLQVASESNTDKNQLTLWKRVVTENPTNFDSLTLRTISNNLTPNNNFVFKHLLFLESPPGLRRPPSSILTTKVCPELPLGRNRDQESLSCRVAIPAARSPNAVLLPTFNSPYSSSSRSSNSVNRHLVSSPSSAFMSAQDIKMQFLVKSLKLTSEQFNIFFNQGLKAAIESNKDIKQLTSWINVINANNSDQNKGR